MCIRDSGNIVNSFENGPFGIEQLRLVLRVIADFYIMAQLAEAFVIEVADNYFGQRGFAFAIAAYERHKIAFFNRQLQFVEHQFFAVALAQVLTFNHYPARRRCRGKQKVYSRRIGIVKLNAPHLFEQFYARLHLPGLGAFIAAVSYTHLDVYKRQVDIQLFETATKNQMLIKNAIFVNNQ